MIYLQSLEYIRERRRIGIITVNTNSINRFTLTYREIRHWSIRKKKKTIQRKNKVDAAEHMALESCEITRLQNSFFKKGLGPALRNLVTYLQNLVTLKTLCHTVSESC